MTIEEAHAGTCLWLLEKKEYVDWLDPSKLNEHHGFLWIKGKPGTGKSTLMKFALADVQKRMRDRTSISFFFNARGADLEKSTTGMYRSLLLQLLSHIPKLQDKCVSLILGDINENYEWNVEALKSTFAYAVGWLGNSSVMCLIDALDECDVDQIWNMVSFFENLAEQAATISVKFQVCFSSRHYPQVTFLKGLTFNLEDQVGHDEDIRQYLNRSLKIGSRDLMRQIRADFENMAAGVFLWVVLVVGILNKKWSCGQTQDPRKQLHKTPRDLHELFRSILNRDDDYRDHMLLCIQWVLFAREPLNLNQLYCAILSIDQPKAFSELGEGDEAAATIEIFIVSSSKGLAEITKGNKPTVQFIHESVRDFLLTKNGLSVIWPDFGDRFRGESHDRLKVCCLNYVKAITTGLDFRYPLALNRFTADRSYPLLRYAIRGIIYHANAAEGDATSQKDFLQTFQQILVEWTMLGSFFTSSSPPYSMHCTTAASLLYILALYDAGNLIRCYPENTACFFAENEWYCAPIMAALCKGNNEATIQLLIAQANKQPPTSQVHDLCRRLNQDAAVESFINVTFSLKRGVLSASINAEYDVIADIILLESVDSDARSASDLETQLHFAVHHRSKNVVHLLLEHGADIEAIVKDRKTALLWAAGYGDKDIILVLLEKGADVEAKDKDGTTPLICAVKYRSEEDIIHLLLEKGANVMAKDNDGKTPLRWALQCNKIALVHLIEAGADFEE